MNKTMLTGNIGKDAEIRPLENGQSVISFNVAVTERWTNKQGEKQEKTEWFNCSIFRQSDKTSIAKYLLKGTKVYIEGKISARAYTNQAGEIVPTLNLNVSELEFLGGANNNTAGGSNNTPEMTNAPVTNTDKADDDLPF